MEIRISLKFVLWIIAIATVVYLASHVRLEGYQIKGECIDKFTSGDRNGQVYYNVIYRMEDGEIEEDHNIYAANYYRSHIGSKYFFDRTKWVWK